MRVFVVLAVLLSLYQTAGADVLDVCLRSILTKSDIHRIDKEDGVKNCFDINKASITKETCYKKAANIKNVVRSSSLHSKILNTCFYEVGTFSNLNNCLSSTSTFQLANDHDDAVFYCYQTFQETLNKNNCVTIANKLILPMKKDYLKRHCLQN